jgi:16S rRNA (cytidine1402-2'-O)-methyltransferase
MEAGPMSGRLVLCGTPIGNLEDISERAVRALRDADVIACEDTRRTRKLLSHLGIKARELVVYHDNNERKQAPTLVEMISLGRTVVLVTDAGMPGLSDPGYRLVKACIDAGLHVDVVPGPTAAITALVVSGIAPARFVFEGFIPRKTGDRRRRFEELAGETRTIVFFESPHRIGESLADALDVLGDRPAALARELTKLHEEVRRGTLSDLVASVEREAPRGEIVVVISGAIHEHKKDVADADLAARARALMDDGIDRKEALSRVARETGVARRRVFDALIDRDG